MKGVIRVEQSIAGTAGQFGGAVDMPGGKAPEAATQPAATGDSGNWAASKHLYAGREWTAEHPLNIRLTIPTGIGNYYVTLVAGKERRARARLSLDRRQNPLDTPANIFFLAFVFLITTAGSMTLFYLLLAHAFNWPGRIMF